MVNLVLLVAGDIETVNSGIFYLLKLFFLTLGQCRLFGIRLYRQEFIPTHLLNVFHLLIMCNDLNKNPDCRENTL